MRYLHVLLLFGFLTTRILCRPHSAQNVEESEADETVYESDDAESDDTLEEEMQPRNREESAVDDEAEDEAGQESVVQSSNKNSFLQRSVNAPSRASNDNFSGYKKRKANDDDSFVNSIPNNEYQSASDQRDKNLVDQSDIHRFSNHDENLKSPRDEKSQFYRQPQAVSNEDGDVLFEHNENNPKHRERTNKNNYEKPVDANSQFQYSKQAYNSIQEGVPNNDGNKYSEMNYDRNRRAVQDSNDTIQNGSSVNIDEPLSNAAAAANTPVNIVTATDASAVNAAASNKITTDNGASDGAAVANAAEDEEAAIKRHVKKLSAEELQELLNSLSEDKRQLLKKIMESNSDGNNDINKREITKKAGAAPDDNSYLESGQSESNKMQEGSVGPELNLQNTSPDTIDLNNKPSSAQPTDLNSFPIISKSSDGGNDSLYSASFADGKVSLTKSNENSVAASNNQAKIQVDLTDSSNQVSNLIQTQSKTETKREAKADQGTVEDKEIRPFDGDLLSEFRYFCPQDEEISEIDDESELNSKDSNILKREIPPEKDNDISNSIKSLEESFPNSNSYDDDDPYSGSDMAPLVRVKRKNLDLSIKKRAANIMPDAKVAYFPYRAENDDEDNDEGNEFDDDGFYDRTSNLAKSDVKDTLSEDGAQSNFEEISLQHKSDNTNLRPDLQINSNPSKVNNNEERDTAGLGSDTDSVLSGVEGIDENLMFNSAARNRRTLAKDANSERAEKSTKEQNRLARSTTLDEEMKSVSENNAIVPNYQEKDAFGPLPRNYEGDLSRYKRIRRIKQPASSVDVSSNT